MANLAGLIRGAIGRLTGRGKSFSNLFDEDAPGWMTLDGKDKIGVGARDTRGQIAEFRSTVYACTTLISAKAPTVPLRLYYKKGKKVKEIEDHIFLDMWQGVNPWTTNFEMVELTIDDLCLTGNSYYSYIRNNFGYPVEMYRLPPATNVVVKNGEVVGYQVGQGDKKVAFAVEDVLHFKIPDPSNQYLGMGYVAAAAQSLALKNRIDVSEHAGLKNMFQPGGILMLDGQPENEDTFYRILKQFNDAYSGAAKRGKLAAFHGVKELKTFDFPIKDFGFLQGRSDIRNELYSIWKVPLTFGDRKTTPGRATIEADQIGLLEYAVKPHLLRMQEKITESLLSQYDSGPGKLFCEFDIESAMPADREYMLRERETNIRSGFSVPDEERAKMGEGPRPDGAGDVVWVQYGQIPASLAKEMSADILESETGGEAEVTAEDEATPKPESEPDIDTEGETEGKGITAKAKGKAVKKKTIGLPAMTVEKKVTPQMIQMRRGVRKAYGKLLKETIKRVKSAG